MPIPSPASGLQSDISGLVRAPAGIVLNGRPGINLPVGMASNLPQDRQRRRERIKYLRGGQAEGLIAWLLEGLDDDWHIFNGIKLERESDIDHILIGPAGVFCISTKSHRGLFTGTSDGLLHNGQSCPFAKDAMRQAMTLRDRLAALMGKDVPFVQPVLAVPFGYVEGAACGGKVWVRHQDDITSRIAPKDTRRRLSEKEVAPLVGVLEMFEKDARYSTAAQRRPRNFRTADC